MTWIIMLLSQHFNSLHDESAKRKKCVKAVQVLPADIRRERRDASWERRLSRRKVWTVSTQCLCCPVKKKLGLKEWLGFFIKHPLGTSIRTDQVVHEAMSVISEWLRNFCYSRYLKHIDKNKNIFLNLSLQKIKLDSNKKEAIGPSMKTLVSW